MSHLQFTLNELEVPGDLLEEALRVLVNSILLTRQTESLGLTQVTSPCGISYFTLKDPELKDDVELNIKVLANLLQSAQRAVVSLALQDRSSNEMWEEWHCPFRITDNDKLEVSLRARVLEIIQIVCSNSTHIPPLVAGDHGRFPFKLSFTESEEPSQEFCCNSPLAVMTTL